MEYDFHAYGDAFSVVYDLRWGRFASSFAPRLIEYIRTVREGSAEDTVVCDLCCGTGQLTSALAAGGYHVHAVDQSPGMIARCRRNNAGFIESGQVEVSLQSAQSVTLPAAVDVTVALFDALNHLPTIEDLAQTFASVAVLTRPGGWFLFDLNTRLGLNRWNGMEIDENEAWFVVLRGLFAPEMDRAYTAVSGFVDDGGTWRRFSEVIYNTPFAIRDVADALRHAGWKDVRFLSPENLKPFTGNPEELGRVFIIAENAR